MIGKFKVQVLGSFNNLIRKMKTKIIEKSHPDYDELRGIYQSELSNMVIRAAQESAAKVLEAALDEDMVGDIQRILTNDFRGWYCGPKKISGKLLDFDHVGELPEIITKNMERN